MIFRTTLLVSLLLCSGCGLLSSEDGFEPRVTLDELLKISLEPGIHNESISLGQGNRLYFTLAVPNIPPGGQVPLVVALHPADDVITPNFSEAYLRTQVEPALGDLGALLFAPDVTGASWTDLRSEAALLAFLEKAIDLWPVDPEQVAVTGYSMGGVGTWFLTERHPDLFSAGIPVAARPIGNVMGKVPLYVIHSRQDELFALQETREIVEALQRLGAPVELHVIENISHFQTTGYVPQLRSAATWMQRLWSIEVDLRPGEALRP